MLTGCCGKAVNSPDKIEEYIFKGGPQSPIFIIKEIKQNLISGPYFFPSTILNERSHNN